MKKVLFYIYSLNKGGAERVLVTLAQELAKQYEVLIVTDVYDDLEYELPEMVRRINLADELSDKRRILPTSVQRLVYIRKICCQEKADIVIAFMISGAIRAILGNIGSGLEVVGAVRSNPYEDYNSFFKRFWVHFVFHLSSGIICQTKYQTMYFSKSLQKKCKVIANPIQTDFLAQSNKPFSKNDSDGKNERKTENKIVTVGRLYDYKNHKMLIRAFKEISEEFPEYSVMIYGEGPYRLETERYIRELHMQERVFLLGDSSTVAKDIKNAALFVLPSDTEGMPNALMEAMALELPVIATDCPCGGPKSLIRDGENGYLCKVGDSKELAQKMRKLLTDRNLARRFGVCAGKVREQYSIEKISRQWSDYIENQT